MQSHVGSPVSPIGVTASATQPSSGRSLNPTHRDRQISHHPLFPDRSSVQRSHLPHRGITPAPNRQSLNAGVPILSPPHRALLSQGNSLKQYVTRGDSFGPEFSIELRGSPTPDIVRLLCSINHNNTFTLNCDFNIVVEHQEEVLHLIQHKMSLIDLRIHFQEIDGFLSEGHATSALQALLCAAEGCRDLTFFTDSSLTELPQLPLLPQRIRHSFLPFELGELPNSLRTISISITLFALPTFTDMLASLFSSATLSELEIQRGNAIHGSENKDQAVVQLLENISLRSITCLSISGVLLGGPLHFLVGFNNLRSLELVCIGSRDMHETIYHEHRDSRAIVVELPQLQSLKISTNYTHFLHVQSRSFLLELLQSGGAVMGHITFSATIYSLMRTLQFYYGRAVSLNFAFRLIINHLIFDQNLHPVLLPRTISFLPEVSFRHVTVLIIVVDKIWKDMYQNLFSWICQLPDIRELSLEGPTHAHPHMCQRCTELILHFLTSLRSSCCHLIHFSRLDRHNELTVANIARWYQIFPGVWRKHQAEENE